MGVKLQLVLGVLLFSSVWTASSTSGDINSTKPQEHSNDDRNTNTIEKQPKTETEIKYLNKNTPTDSKIFSESNNKHLETSSSETADDTHEKQNEVEKDIKAEHFNALKKDAAPKRREETARSIDIEKYISPEFQNNEFTLPVSSDTEKYLEEPFGFKLSTRKGQDFDYTTPKTSMFSKFTEPIQKLEHEYEEHLKDFDHDHHSELEDDHIEIENDHDDEHEHESEVHDMDEDMTVDKMIERSESVPTNISVDWEMKISKKDDPDRNKNKNVVKGFTVVKYRKVDYVSQYNDTKVLKYPLESKDDQNNLNMTTAKPLTSTTRKNNLLTKPPVDTNNSHLLSNKIETETIKAINLVTTQPPTTRKTKGDTESSSKEQVVQENKLTTVQAFITPNDQSSSTDLIIEEITTEQNDKREITMSKIDTTEQADSDQSLSMQQTTALITEEVGMTGKGVRDSNINSTVSDNKLPDRTIHPTTEFASTMSDNSTIEQSIYPSTTVSSEEDPFLGTDITTNNDMDVTTNTETTKLPANISSRYGDTNVQSAQPSVTTFLTTEVEISDNTKNQGTEFHSTMDTETNTETTVTIGKYLGSDTTPYTTPFETTTDSSTDTSTELVETTENTPVTVSLNGIMSDATTIMLETSTRGIHIIPSKDPEFGTITEKKEPTIESTEKITQSTSVVLTSEVNFIHVETFGTNQTTFVPETLSPNFSYPMANNGTKERNIKNNDVSPAPAETTTIEEVDDTTGTSSATENIVVDGGGDNKGKIAAIVISSVGAICLVVLAGLLYIMKKRQRKFNYKQRCRPVSLDDYSVDNLSAYNSVRRKGNDRQSKRSYGNPAFEDPTVPSHPLNFPALAKFATNTTDMKSEFEEIPQISARTSELPDGCETKNRYANVIPLPETRVFLKPLQGSPNSDYINANYVTGPKNARCYYIACQAPMQNTVDDFWRMIWEQQCRVILMITHLFENGVEKCVDYLPPSEVLDCHRLFGDFQITLKKREAKEKYIISSLQLKNMVSNSWREVTHFWYLGWPEKGIPPEANSMIAFLIEARSYMKTATLDTNMSPDNIRHDPSQNEINPVVVHCSPGTGRTGVVIACDIAIREFEKNRLVDIPKIVYRIRRNRANAVQSKEQYMFIYKVISLYATKLTGGALESF